GRSRATAVRDAGPRGVGTRQLRQVPAAPEAGVVQPRRGAATSAEPQVTKAHSSLPADLIRRERLTVQPPDQRRSASSFSSEMVRDFYERRPYPPPFTSLDGHRDL